MAIDAPSSPNVQPWSDRLRHSTIILIAAALALSVVVSLGELSALHAAIVFLCIAAAALIPWRPRKWRTSYGRRPKKGIPWAGL